MKTKAYILTLLAACLMSISASASEERKVYKVEFAIGSTAIDPAFGDNASELARMDSLLDLISSGKQPMQGPVVIEGVTSPDGPKALNERIAISRRRALHDYIARRYPSLSSRIEDAAPVIAWSDLARLIEASDEPWKQEVLAIINDTPAAGRADTRNSRLKALKGGRIWRILAKEYLPQLRISSAIVTIIEPEPEPEPTPIQPVVAVIPEPADTVETVEVIDSVAIATPITLPDSIFVEHVKPNRYWSLNTNMLADAALIPNVGFDIYLGKNFSLDGNWHYAWWSKKSKARFWRTYGGTLGARWWFGEKAHEKPLQGHHIGIYAQMLLYDFEWGNKGYLSGTPGKTIFDHPTWGGGIEYGYSLPVSKHLNIDFNIGVGYLTGRYWEYEPHDGHFIWLNTKKRHYFGPTKVEVSLVWLLGNGNFNAGKGGDR